MKIICSSNENEMVYEFLKISNIGGHVNKTLMLDNRDYSQSAASKSKLPAALFGFTTPCHASAWVVSCDFPRT